MKRLFLVTIFLVTLFLVACGGSKDSTGTIEVKVYNVESELVYSGEIDFQEDDSLIELLKEHEEIQMKGEDQSFGFYIIEMSGISAEDYENVFWNIKVNGEDSLVGISQIELVDGDLIEFALISWE